MSNTNPEKRREAGRRYYKNNKNKIRSRNQIRYLARKAHHVAQTCSFKGCKNIGERHHPDYSKPTDIIWLCRTHHCPVHHHQRCTICGDKGVGRGLCNKHYKMDRKKDPVFFQYLRDYKNAWRKKRIALGFKRT